LKVAKGWVLQCIGCDKRFDSDPQVQACPKCGNLLQLEKRGTVSKSALYAREGEGIWRYTRGLPFEKGMDPISLGEGGTPLIRSVHIGRDLGLKRIFVKNEGQNPTGSFKDRGMTVSVSRAVQAGARVLICASTGNTSASMTAYAARSGITAVIVVPSGKVAAGKLAQAVVYGAKIIRAEGTFDDALALTLKAVEELPELFMMNSVNPYRIEGQKTTAFEIYEQLGFRVPDYVVLPVGNAGNISAIWKGFKELKEWGIARTAPKMIGVQAEGASPIAKAFESGRDSVTPVDDPHTVASAIRIGNPASWRKALSALRESGGLALSVTDEEIVSARFRLAASEGIFVEPASAAPIAALSKLKGRIGSDASVVCVATGNGLKDQETIQTNLERTPMVADQKSLVKLLRDLAR
jgi:threonine synthase